MKQVMNHNKDNGLLNMIRRTDTMILNRFFFKTLQKYTLFLNHPSNFNKIFNFCRIPHAPGAP